MMSGETFRIMLLLILFMLLVVFIKASRTIIGDLEGIRGGIYNIEIAIREKK